MSTQTSKTSQNSSTNLAETTNSEEIDLVEKSLRANGCWETHLTLSECVADKRDWRACQSEVKLLQDCMKKANEKRNLKK